MCESNSTRSFIGSNISYNLTYIARRQFLRTSRTRLTDIRSALIDGVYSGFRNIDFLCSPIIIASSSLFPLFYLYPLSYSSNRFMLLINSIICFIICDWPNNLSTFSLPFPMSFIIFFLCSLYLRYSNR